REPVLGKELLDRQPRQLHAQHRMPARRKPGHVQRLACQRHEYPRPGRNPDRVPVLFKERRDPLLVEADAAVLPTPMPETRIHAAYATDKPSTFCHPRGNNPPRLARLPMYASRSRNDSDIVRAPDCTSRVPPG